MITLTTPVLIVSAIGGNTTHSYNKVVLDNLMYSPVTQTVMAQVRLSSSADTTQPVFNGSVFIDLSASSLDISIPDVNFRTHLTLSPDSVVAVRGFITTAQSQIESGLINLGVAVGAYSAGV